MLLAISLIPTLAGFFAHLVQRTCSLLGGYFALDRQLVCGLASLPGGFLGILIQFLSIAPGLARGRVRILARTGAKHERNGCNQ